MKEPVTKVIDTLTRDDFHGAFKKLLERYKCIAAGGDYFEVDYSFLCVLSIKVLIRKMSGNLFNDTCVYIYIYIYLYIHVCARSRVCACVFVCVSRYLCVSVCLSVLYALIDR